jgi:hypothetical protein
MSHHAKGHSKVARCSSLPSNRTLYGLSPFGDVSGTMSNTVSEGDFTRIDGGTTTLYFGQVRNQRGEAREATSNQEQWLVFNLSLQLAE